MGVQPPSGALLYGPPGNGKTLLVQALASTCGVPAFTANGSRLFGQYVGETELRIRALFRQVGGVTDVTDVTDVTSVTEEEEGR